MYKLGTIREFKIQNFHVIIDAVEETDLDLSWDDSGETRKGLENGSLIAFCARTRVFLRGLEVSSDYLGNCAIYKSTRGLRADHKECAAYTRKLWKREGKFNIYKGGTRGVLPRSEKLKARGFATKERAEAWAKKHFNLYPTKLSDRRFVAPTSLTRFAPFAKKHAKRLPA